MKRLFVAFATLVFVLAACAPSASASIVGEWTLVSYGDESNPISAMPGVDTSIEFKSDGTLGGNFGCNSLGGEYKIKGDVIEFGPIIMTEMFCEATAEQEAGVVAVLSGIVRFALNDDTLTISSSDGSSVVELTRK